MIDPFTDVKPWIRTTSHGGALLAPLIRKDLHCVPQSLLWFSLNKLWAQQFKSVLSRLERDPALTEAYICATFTKTLFRPTVYMDLIQKWAALSSQVSPIWSKRSDINVKLFFRSAWMPTLFQMSQMLSHISLQKGWDLWHALDNLIYKNLIHLSRQHLWRQWLLCVSLTKQTRYLKI